MQRPRLLADIIPIIEANIRLKGEDPYTRHGFTRIPNNYLGAKSLSAHDKLVLVGLLRYAWQKDQCLPGQRCLADLIGLSERAVNRSIAVLKRQGIITVVRRGTGRTNLNIINVRTKVVQHACVPFVHGAPKAPLPCMPNNPVATGIPNPDTPVRRI